MPAISATTVKELREKTGVGMMECKKALNESDGDIEKAISVLRKKGFARAEKRAGRTASQGVIMSYIHMDKIGVMVELNCETDFVARNDDFRNLAKDIAMHVAAANPPYLTSADVPQDVIQKEKDIYRDQVKGKPENIIDKILDGKLKKYYEENCLVDQVFVKDPDGKKKIRDILTDAISRIGENIILKRFVRFQLGEE